MKIGVVGAHGNLGKSLVGSLKIDFQVLEILKTNPEKVRECEWLIDCTSGEAFLEYLPILKKQKLVIVSSGWKEENLKKFLKFETYFIPNLSLIIQSAVKLLMDLPKSLTVEIIDYHRQGKKDPLSGTALWIMKLLEKRGHKTFTKAIRYDDLKGSHEIILKFQDEQLLIRHDVFDRSAYGNGMAYFFKHEKEYFKLENYLS